MIRFSLKNATKELSPIRLRINLNGERMTFYLPQDYKIRPKHWDKEVGGAIEDSKRNPDLKGNPQLQLIMRNINKEIEKTTNALITVLEELNELLYVPFAFENDGTQVIYFKAEDYSIPEQFLRE